MSQAIIKLAAAVAALGLARRVLELSGVVLEQLQAVEQAVRQTLAEALVVDLIQIPEAVAVLAS